MRKVIERLSKEEYCSKIAKAVSKRFTRLRRKYSSAIFVNNSIISIGYNGNAREVVNCFEVSCIKDMLNLSHSTGYNHCPAVHVELYIY
ncbi:MAG: hypothetical protein QXD89_00520 [Candidatus Aenigmatarchaeota archaeon]